MLYIRTFLIMFVGLYTSRVILKTLGVNDYGVYNVVGGFVSMLAYLNSVFVDATQRFMSFTLGEGNTQKLNTLFKTSMAIHFIIALIVLLVAESFGLWFVNAKLQIPPDRMVAANWVYQCSVFSLLLLIINIPYRACVVAHEHMNLYAYISVVDALLKLCIVFLLVLIPGDKLIIYALLYLTISISIPLCFTLYCKRRFRECTFGFKIDRSLFKEMFGYAGWVLVGNLGFSFKDQFSNVIMNLFLGSAINASRGLATQVNGIVTSFGNSFMTALAPQITKSYAAGNLMRSQKLIVSGARYSFFLMSLFVIPICVNIDYVLHLWLGKVPEYTSIFVIIILIASTFYSASKTLTIGIQATGNIKVFQIGISIIMLLELPIAYLLLKNGYAPYYALLPAILTQILGIVFRVIVLKQHVPSFDLNKYLTSVFCVCLPLMAACYISFLFINKLFEITFWTFVITSLLYVSIICIVVCFVGLNPEERKLMKNFVIEKIQFHKFHKDESNN